MELQSINVLEMEEGTGNHSTHPLMSLCLMLIFAYVADLQDLKNIRLVCRLWRDAGMEKWRSTAVVRLAWERYHRYSFCHACHRVINQVDYKKEALDLLDFLALFKKSKEKCPYQLANFPFHRYRIGYASLSEGDEVMKEFWRRCGAHIKFLYLDHCSAPDSRFGTAFQQIKLGKCPKLEELIMHLVPTEEKFGLNVTHELVDFQRGQKVIMTSQIPLKLKTMKLNICKKKECDPGPGESRIYHVTPTTKQWRTLFQLVPNLKNLIVDWEISNAIEALKYPTVTGKPIKLSKLSFSVKDNHVSDADNLSLPAGLKEYVRIVKPPIKFVEVVAEKTRWNRSFFRDLIWRKLHHPHVRRLRIALASFCYTYVFLHFLKMFLEWLHPPNQASSSSAAAGYGFGDEWNMKNRMLRRSLRHLHNLSK